MDIQNIQRKIYEVREQRVMLDYDLAILYNVETKALNQAVKRNIKRFPTSFMFRLTLDEWNEMRSQFVTASAQTKRNVKAMPYAFTEHGVTMLASVLRSNTAIQINIAIVEAFIALRRYSSNYNSLKKELKQLELKNSKQFKEVIKALKFLLEKDEREENQKNRKRIGFQLSPCPAI